MSTTLGIANVRHPAATALATPVGESSMATQSLACTPRRLAAVRYGSGCGLPLVTSSPVMTTSNVPGGSVRTTASANRVQLIVTSACGIPALRTASNVSRAPGRHGTLRCTRAMTPSSNRLTMSSMGRSTPPCSRRIAADTRRSLPTMACAFSWSHWPPNSATNSYSHSIQYGSVSTMVPSMSHSTAAGRATARRFFVAALISSTTLVGRPFGEWAALSQSASATRRASRTAS